MTHDHQSDLEPDDAEELAPVAAWLEHNRPVPTAAFRGALRRDLMANRRSTPARPRRLWLLASSSFCGGTALLAVAAIGVAGTGPFAA